MIAETYTSLDSLSLHQEDNVKIPAPSTVILLNNDTGQTQYSAEFPKVINVPRQEDTWNVLGWFSKKSLK